MNSRQGYATSQLHIRFSFFNVILRLGMAQCVAMLLTHAELESLVQTTHRSPHQLLGMHPLGDGTGVIVRALLPNAAQVEIIPTHEKAKPKIKLERLHESGLFEGMTKGAQHVYAYDLVITDFQGNVRRTRDPYSFLPTL